MTKITAKQQAIMNAYGVYWEQVKDFVDDNGAICSMDLPPHISENIEFNNYDFQNKKVVPNDNYNYTDNFQPKQLEGIETNNGWVKIEGIVNEIKGSDAMWVMAKNGAIEYWRENEIGYATHYQPISKPQPPIY